LRDASYWITSWAVTNSVSGDGEAERLGGLEFDDQINFRSLLRFQARERRGGVAAAIVLASEGSHEALLR
jgi:hypothetical protein